MDMEIFDHDDEGYVAWLKNNPTGYVLNCRQKAQYHTLHRAMCKYVNSTKPSYGAEWTSEYKKICATDRASIEKHIQRKPKYCRTCFPKSVLRAKPPRAAEDWIEKGDHVFAFIRNTVKLYRVDGNGARTEITDLDEVAHILCWGRIIRSKTAKRILKDKD